MKHLILYYFIPFPFSARSNFLRPAPPLKSIKLSLTVIAEGRSLTFSLQALNKRDFQSRNWASKTKRSVFSQYA